MALRTSEPGIVSPMNARVATHENGFTIMEVLVAMFLATLIGAAITSSLVFTSNVVGENTLEAEAITHAQKALEDLRTYAYDDIASGSETSPDGRFTIAREVWPDTPESGMKRIDVTVSWSWKGQARTYVLHTVYTRVTKS